jgi:DNA-binding winged helix-turn-helix (wHTH) protein
MESLRRNTARDVIFLFTRNQKVGALTSNAHKLLLLLLMYKPEMIRRMP